MGASSYWQPSSAGQRRRTASRMAADREGRPCDRAQAPSHGRACLARSRSASQSDARVAVLGWQPPTVPSWSPERRADHGRGALGHNAPSASAPLPQPAEEIGGGRGAAGLPLISEHAGGGGRDRRVVNLRPADRAVPGSRRQRGTLRESTDPSAFHPRRG